MSLKHTDSVVGTGAICLTVDANQYEKAVILLGLLMVKGVLTKDLVQKELRRDPCWGSDVYFITRTQLWKDIEAVADDSFKGRQISELKETGYGKS